MFPVSLHWTQILRWKPLFSLLFSVETDLNRNLNMLWHQVDGNPSWSADPLLAPRHACRGAQVCPLGFISGRCLFLARWEFVLLPDNFMATLGLCRWDLLLAPFISISDHLRKIHYFAQIISRNMKWTVLSPSRDGDQQVPTGSLWLSQEYKTTSSYAKVHNLSPRTACWAIWEHPPHGLFNVLSSIGTNPQQAPSAILQHAPDTSQSWLHVHLYRKKGQTQRPRVSVLFLSHSIDLPLLQPPNPDNLHLCLSFPC